MILWLFGYKIDKSVIDALKSQKIVIFPHTSLFESFIALIAFIQIDRTNISFLVTSYYYDNKIIGPILRKFGGIRVGNSGGLVNDTINYLKDNKNKVLLLSPEGSLSYKEWKSGFYYIAKELQIPIVVGGIDFYTHTLKCNLNDTFSNYQKPYNESLDEIKTIFSKSEIYPLYPEKSNPHIKGSFNKRVSYFPLNRYIIVIGIAIFFSLRLYTVL